MINHKKEQSLTHERLTQLFHYDPESGLLTRRIKCSASPAGKVVISKNTNGHLQVRVDKKMFLVHRLAWFYQHKKWPTYLDHVNGERGDNRLVNLREVTIGGNNQNIRRARKGSKTGLLGVSFKKSSGKFVAQISINKTIRHLGLFADPEEAHQAYLQAKRANHQSCTI